jgi:large subunit ribosomal protein L1
MAKHGKRYLEAAKLVDPEKQYAPLEAAALVKKTANTKFDQTVEVHIRLGVDPRQSEGA